MADDNADLISDLKARIEALEAEAASHPHPPAPYAPPPMPAMCGVCQSFHQKGQHSHCLTCRMPIGCDYPCNVNTEPCPTCGAKGVLPRRR